MKLEEARKTKRGKMRNRFIFRTVILLILIGAVVFALVNNYNRDKKIYKVGDEAPDFELIQVNEADERERVRLSDLRGKGVMLNFWATYCKPCEKEMPYMQSLYPEYKDKGIEIVAVSLDDNGLVIQQFIEKYDLTFPIPHDTKREVMDLYKVGPIPSTFFINPDGEIVEIVAGELSLERLESYFQQIQPE